MHVFAISAAMVGVCLTAIGILRLVAVQMKVQTLGDELLPVNAVIFVVLVVQDQTDQIQADAQIGRR